MKREISQAKKKLWISVAVVTLTVVYLLATSVVTMAVYNSSATNITYGELPSVNFGGTYEDVYIMTQANYASSNYSKTGTTTSLKYYNVGGTNNSSATIDVPVVYGTVSLNNKTAPAGTEVKLIEYSDLYSNTAEHSVASSVTLGDGSVISLGSVPALGVKTAGSNATYTVVPGSEGAYFIYVFSESSTAPVVNYTLVDRYQDANSVADGGYEGALAFTKVSGNWWKASVTVTSSGQSWMGYTVTNTTTKKSSRSDVVDTVTYNGSTTNLNSIFTLSDRYYNVWDVVQVKFDTMLVLNWSDPDISIAPITKAGSITINGDTSLGTINAWNVYGEQLAVNGTAVTTAHAPVFFKGVPADPLQHSFAQADSQYDDVSGCYKYDFTANSASLTAGWAELEDLPSVTVTDGTTEIEMDCYQIPLWTARPIRETTTSYTLTVNFEDAADLASITYSITGEVTDSGTLTQANPSVSFDVTWNKTVVEFTVTSTTGTVKTITFTVDPAATTAPVARIGSVPYYYLEDALVAAQSGQTIEVIADCAFYTGTNHNPAWLSNNAGYTVKNGVTLLIPYAPGATNVPTSTTVVEGSHDSTLEYANTALSMAKGEEGDAMDPYAHVYLTVDIPSSVSLYVANGGKFVIGGEITAGVTSGAGVTCATAGDHSNVDLEGTIEVQTGGRMSVCGYILGDGIVNIANDGIVYQPFIIMDYLSGSYTYASNGKNCPFNRYAMLNIQSDIHMVTGAQMMGYIDMYTGGSSLVNTEFRHNVITTMIIGGASDSALIKLGDSGILDISYDADTHVVDDAIGRYNLVGRTTLNFTGGATLGKLTMTIEVSGLSVTIDTSEYFFPIPYNYNIILGGTNATYSLAVPVKLLPGVTMTVENGATLDLKSGAQFAVLDGFRDHIATSETSERDKWYNFHYPKPSCLQASPFNGNGCANLIVNGKLTVNSGAIIAGLIQTDGTTGSVEVLSGATTTVSVAMGLKGSDGSGKSTHTLKGTVVDRETGAFVTLQAGATYTAYPANALVDSFTYTLEYKDKATSKNKTETIVHPLNGTVKGCWYSYSATINTIRSDGNTTSRTAYFAHGASAAGYFTDEACTTAASTVTADAMTFYIRDTDSVARVDWADGSASVYYPALSQAIHAANNGGDTAVLLKDQTLTEAIKVPAGQNVIIDLNGKTVTLTGVSVSNAGTLNLLLSGGKITSNTTAVYNTGILSVNGGGGTITSTATGGTIVVSSATGETESLNAVVRNLGTLSMENVKLHQSGADVASAGIVNDRSTINTLKNVDIVCAAADVDCATSWQTSTQAGAGYGIVNLGGTITTIKGGHIYAANGIYNYNIRLGTNSNIEGFSIPHVGTITTIEDTKVRATTMYALMNYGTVGTIGGEAEFYAPTYAVYNGYYYNGSYQHKREDITTLREDGTVESIQRTYYYDTENRATIGNIIGNAKITASAETYAIYNLGKITKIGGSSTISATKHSALANVNGGIVESICENATITADYYAVYSVGQATDHYVKVETKQADGTTNALITESYTYGPVSEIGTISGDMTNGKPGVTLTATSTATDYCIYNNGKIGSITGRVTVNVVYRSAIYNHSTATATREYIRRFNENGLEYERDDYNVRNTDDSGYIGLIGGENSNVTINAVRFCIYSAGNIVSIEGDITFNNTTGYACIMNNRDRQVAHHYIAARDVANPYTVTVDGAEQTYYHNRYDYTYYYDAENFPATIGSISGLTVDKGTNATYIINNQGYIGSITDCDLNAKQYPVYNSATGHYHGERHSLLHSSYSDFTTSSTYRDVAEFSLDYECLPAKIDSIDNNTLTATASYALHNGGYIGSITNNVITAPTYAINNGETVVTYDVTTESPTNPTGTNGEYSKVALLDEYYTYQASVIDLIGEGNTISATTGYAIYNLGRINTIDSGTNKNKITTIYSQSSYGIYNIKGVRATRTTTVVDGAQSHADTYISAELGTIKNVHIMGGNYAIRSVGSATYPSLTIDELGDGLVAVATNSDGYGFRTDDYSTISRISGGYYASNGKTRGYAIHSPDSKPYHPDGYTLSSYTVPITHLADGKEYNCYFITPYNGIVFDAIQLAADGEVMLKLKFYIPTTLLSAEGAYVVVTEEENAIEPEKVATILLSDLDAPDDQGRYILQQGIAAGEMTGTVTVQFYNASGTLQSVYDYIAKTTDTSIERTVLDYSRLSLAEGSEKMKNLSSAMLTFGGYAQQFFEVDTGNLASALLNEFPNVTKYDISKVNLSGVKDLTRSDDVIGITQTTQKINLNSKIYMRTYFELDGEYTIDKFVFKVDGVIVEAVEDNGRYYVDIVNIPPAYWDREYVITVTNTDTSEVYTVTSSVLAWAKRCIAGSTNEAQVNMAKAMYYYNQTANVYFGC